MGVPTWSFSELAAEAKVTERTLRTYLQRGLVPRGSSRGRGASYGREHLDRLRLIARIRAEAPPTTTLEQVRSLLDQLTPEVIRGLVDGSIPFTLLDDGRVEARVMGMPAAAAPGPSIDERSDVPSAESPAQSPAESPIERRFLDRLDLDRLDPVQDRIARRLQQLLDADAAAQPPVASPSRGRTTPFAIDAKRLLGRSSAGLILRRLADRLGGEDGDGTAERGSRRRSSVRASAPPPQTWHRVRAGRDLEIHARGPLDEPTLELLRDTAAALARLMYAPAAERGEDRDADEGDATAPPSPGESAGPSERPTDRPTD